MNLGMIKDSLKVHGQECLRLADRLGEDGKPLNEQEKDLIRVALLPRIKESCLNMQFAFLMNDAMSYDRASDTIHKAFQFLADKK